MDSSELDFHLTSLSHQLNQLQILNNVYQLAILSVF